MPVNPYRFIIPRLNGDEFEDRFDYYSHLVKKGVAGFIIFGGEVESLRNSIRRLQEIAEHPLIIASDLEAGLGQQVRGGTLYPPSMAIAAAMNKTTLGRLDILDRLYSSIASEALYSGINTILAPVLDISSNPQNPIITTRAFGEDPETVSFYGIPMIKTYRKMGIISCGKHFPGHGDTDRDSHHELPVINKDIKELEGYELIPFQRAISSGVDMIMLGHLNVPCLDPSGRPATISPQVISYLRETMGFKGLIITDAMNMGGLSGYSEEEASLIALRAGVNLILHPSDPDSVAMYLGQRLGEKEAIDGRKTIVSIMPRITAPNWRDNRSFAEELFHQAITVEGSIKSIKNPFLIVLTDEEVESVRPFADWFKDAFGKDKVLIINEPFIPFNRIPKGSSLIVSVFSGVRAWKKKTFNFKELLNVLEKKVDVFISFGNPYIIRDFGAPKIYAYSTYQEAQDAMIRYIKEKRLFI